MLTFTNQHERSDNKEMAANRINIRMNIFYLGSRSRKMPFGSRRIASLEEVQMRVLRPIIYRDSNEGPYRNDSQRRHPTV
jgi:hypothetical protein